MKLLILGGYGVFGGRLAELLSDCAQLTLMIAGRTERKAVAFCENYNGAATVIPLGLDRVDTAKALAALAILTMMPQRQALQSSLASAASLS